MATQAAPEGGPWASSLFGVASGPSTLFNTQPDGQSQFRKRAPSMFDTEPDGRQDLRERQLKLFERKLSDPSDPSSSPVEVPMKWDLTREFILYPNGKGGPVKLPSTQHVKRPSPEMVQKLRQGEPEFFLAGCKITPATRISHEWGYEGSILLYDPKDPADSSVEYVYLTDHLPEQSETRCGVLTDPKSNLFFVTLKGDSLPTYHFWQDFKKDGNPGEAEVFDWAAYMDACASRRASEQLDSDTIRFSGELHRANDNFNDYGEDNIDDAINEKCRGIKRSTRLRDDSSDDDSTELGRPSRKHRHAPTPKPPPGRVSYDDFFLESGDDEPEGEALHRGLRNLFGSGYYECPMDRFEYADPEVERLAREFEENLRVQGLESTLRDFGFWQGDRSKKNQHFGGRSPPSEPPKRSWPKNTVLDTVAYKLAVASTHTKGLPPLKGNEPWTRDDGIGFWTFLDLGIKPRVPNRLQKQDPTRYRRPTGVTKERNKNENIFTGALTDFRSRLQRAAREPSYIGPWEKTSWQPKLQVDSDIELHQHLRRIRRRPKKSNLRQTPTRSTLPSSRPTHYPSSGRDSEWRTATSSDISSRLALPSASSFRMRSTRSYPDSSPSRSPASDAQPTTPDPRFPHPSSSSSSPSSFPTRTDPRETSAPSTPPSADSWRDQNSRPYGPLRQRGSFARFATASLASSGTHPSSSPSSSRRATRPHRRPARGKRRVSFDVPGGSEAPFREVRLRDGRVGAGAGAFRVWLWGGARGGGRRGDFWRIAAEVLGEEVGREVELRVYDGTVPDTLWLDRRVSGAVFEREVGGWLSGVETDEVYLIPVPEEVQSALHKLGDDGEQVQRYTCQVCTQDLTSMPDWLKRHHYRRHGRGRPPRPYADFDVALLAERVRERPGAYRVAEGLEHHEARVARRRAVAERAYARVRPEWDGVMRAGTIFDEGVVPGREFGDDGEERSLDDEEEGGGERGVPSSGLEGERREREHVPDEVGPAVDLEEEPLPRCPELDEVADVPAAPSPPPPYRTLFGLPRRSRSGRGGPAQDIARVPVSNRSIRRMPDVSRNREQSAATAATARERFHAKKDNGELHRSLASKASRHHPYQRGVAGELHRRVASDPGDEEEEGAPRWLHRRGDRDEESSRDGVQTASSVVPEGLKIDIASGRPVAEIEGEWLEEINESVALSRFWLRLRAALVLDEQLRAESEDERLAREASVVPAEQSMAEGESGVLGEVVDSESEAQQSQLSSSSRRKAKKGRTAGDKRPANKKRKPASEPDESWRPSKQLRVEEVPEEFEEPEEEKKKGRRKAKGKGIEKTMTFEVKNQPIAEPEATAPESMGKTAGRKRSANTPAALTKKPAAKTKTMKSPTPKRLSPKTKGRKRKDRSRGPSPEPERASEGATRYSLRKR